MATSKLYEAYAQDATAGEAGLWVTDLLIPVKIRSLSSRAVRKVQADMAKKYRQAEMAGNGTLPPDAADRKASDVLARGVVCDWGAAAAARDGVVCDPDLEATDAEGTALPFSVEAALKLFADLPDFRNDIMMIAASRETFRKAALEGLKGNSAAPSPSGSTSPAPTSAS